MPIEEMIHYAIVIPGSLFVLFLFLLLVAAHVCDPDEGDDNRAPF